MILRRLSVLCLPILLAACAAQPLHRAARLESVAPLAAAKPVWPFDQSDLTPDPAFRFGLLPNGMRFIIRHNATPKGTAQVRMQVEAGSLDEGESERGFAHYVEHMAFNGSTHVPEGEMIKLLERDGLAFGADTNAQTSFEQTLYMLDLPRTDAKLLDTALMLMRETASELTFDPAAVARERGVVLSELRDGEGYALANARDQLAFLYPATRYPQRLPIGTAEALKAASAEALKAFWARHYVPAKTTLIVVGDFDPDGVETAIRARFASWAHAPSAERPDPGRVLAQQQGETRIHLDPALSERVTISRHGPWLDEPDTAGQRRINLLRQIGYSAINRRLQRLSRQPKPPFRGAGLGTSAVFEIGRTTNLIIDTPDRGWKAGLTAAAETWRSALARGFSRAEIAEQLAGIRTALENQVAAGDTRSHGALVNLALGLLRDESVPTTPASGLERFNRFAPTITPASVLAALRKEAVPLKNPLIRFQGRFAPEGGAPALRAAWDAAMDAPLKAASKQTGGTFAYTDFGPAGRVVSDTTNPDLGLRMVRFANGVALNLKRTDLEKNRVLVHLALDGGELLDTKANPLATEMASMLPAGGLGQHSQDDLQSLLAGRSVSTGFSASGDVFTSAALTTPRDLELQLQVLTATISDPGYRAEVDLLYHQNMSNLFARLNATPASALGAALPGLVSGGDPRFTLQPPGAYQSLTMAKLKQDIADRLAHGAIELALVGDFDPDAAIALVARTFGALPQREAAFLPREDARQRSFTATRGLAVVRHQGAPNQALIRYVWPATDAADPVTAMAFELLQEVTGIAVLDTVREALGKSYSPGASVALSRVWRGWGTFSVSASVDLADIAATRASIEGTITGLATRPIDADVLARARAPMREQLDNLLKTNSGWLSLAERAQSQPERIERYRMARARLDALTAADLQALARRYLVPDQALVVLALPEGAPAPAR